MTSIRQRLMLSIGEASMKHGVSVRLEQRSYSGPSLHTEIPARPMSVEGREAVAQRLLRQSTEFATDYLFMIRRQLRRGNKHFEEREAALSLVSGAALEAARRDALVEMLNLGLDADPLFTEVASAESTQDVATAVAAAREQTTRHQELVAS